MRRFGIQHAIGTLAIAAIIWLVAAMLGVMIGSTGTLGWPAELSWRLEPVLLASLVGAALAAAGVAYQAILRNPLADPYLLGVSSGAALFAYLWQFSAATTLVIALGAGGRAMSQQGFAFAGALLAVGVVFLLASNRGRLEPVTLLLVGVIVNAINGSIFLLLNALNKDRPGEGGMLSFLVGNIQTTLLFELKLVALIVIGIGWLVLLYLAAQLNVAPLGEAEAESLGVRIHRLRWAGLIIASLVTAAAVAISGPIGFVGLVCPHLARLMVGTDVRRLLPLATGLGAALLVLADAAARFLTAPGRAQTLLPVGVITGLLGGPFFLLLLWQNRRRSLPGGGS